MSFAVFGKTTFSLIKLPEYVMRFMAVFLFHGNGTYVLLSAPFVYRINAALRFILYVSRIHVKKYIPFTVFRIVVQRIPIQTRTSSAVLNVIHLSSCRGWPFVSLIILQYYIHFTLSSYRNVVGYHHKT